MFGSSIKVALPSKYLGGGLSIASDRLSLMLTQEQATPDAIVDCHDSKAVILTINPDLERSHVREIGDAIDRRVALTTARSNDVSQRAIGAWSDH